MSYETLFLFSLLVTVLVETFVAYAIFKQKYGINTNVVLVSILASSLTLPYFWFILPTYVTDRLFYIIFGETMIILTEAIIYWRLLKTSWKQAITVSMIANLASAAFSLFLGSNLLN